MSNPTAVPGRQRRRSSALARFWWAWLIGVAALVALGALYFRPLSRTAKPLEGYVMDSATLRQEYARWQGKTLVPAETENDFRQAAGRMLRHDYSGAAEVLEKVAKTAQLPVVYNDLGVLYAELNDRARSVNAFRQALAHDISYAPVRANLRRLRGFISDSALPVTREIEPNDRPALANLIALDAAVDGEIAAGTGDRDVFRVDAPPAPRDILAVEVENHAPSLSLGIRVYDSDLRLMDWGRTPQPAGASFTENLSPAPGATLYFELYGAPGTSGAYSLKIQPARAYDAFEPDDDIFSAHPLTAGEPVDANIMDSRDTDFYSFRSPRTGTVTIAIQNRSATLIPALSMFGPDKSTAGFGPDVRTPGASLRQVMNVEANQTYYIQVWSQARTSGNYSVVVE